MKNKREQEAIRAYFAQEPVPVEIHNALRQACQQLPPREESLPRRRRKPGAGWAGPCPLRRRPLCCSAA